VKLYVCYGTRTAGGSVHRHPCGEAHDALVAAGHAPAVIRSYGVGPLPGLINDRTPRREVKKLIGNYWVPVLATDDREVVQGYGRRGDPSAAPACAAARGVPLRAGHRRRRGNDQVQQTRCLTGRHDLPTGELVDRARQLV